MDAGIRNNGIARLDSLDKLRVFLGLFLLRPDKQEVENNEDEDQRHHRHEEVWCLRGCRRGLGK